MAEHPRKRMIDSAVVLMAEQGLEATSFSRVVAHSGAPRGSIYHHFPGGKAELVEEATRHAGEVVAELLTAALEQDDPMAGIDALGAYWTDLLLDSDFELGCPVLAATVEGERSPAARYAARAAFDRWEDLHAAILHRAGVSPKRARSLASTAISAIEGAVILSRARRSTEPLQRAVGELQTMMRRAVEQVEAPRR